MALPVQSPASTRLRTTASSASLPRLPSTYKRCNRSDAATTTDQPSLADLIRAEQLRDEASSGPPRSALDEAHSSNETKPRARRRSSAPLAAESESSSKPERPAISTSDTMPALSTFASRSHADEVLPAVLLPPHYGRPARPSSPDAFA